MTVQILGKGCPKCKQVEANVRNVTDDYEKIYDIVKASEMGMTQAPGLAINGDIVIQGRVPTTEEIRDAIDAH